MKKIFKLLSIIIICLIILCLCVYFIVTSSFFIKNIAFPVTGYFMNAEIKVEKVVFSPFAGDCEIKNLEVKSADGYSLKLGEYNSNINLFSLFKGIIKINQLKLKNTDIAIVQEVSFEKKNKEQGGKQTTHTEASNKDISDFIVLDINNIKIDNLNIKYTVKRTATKESSVMELSKFNVTVPRLKTGTDGTIDYKGLLQVGPENGENNLTGELTGKIYTKLSNYSLPTLVKLTSTAKFGDEVTPIEIVFESSRNRQLQTFPFKLKTKITDFPLLPLFKAFLEGGYSDSSGKLNYLYLDISGSDLIDPDIYTDINGSFKTDIVELYIPYNLTEYKPVQIIFLPIKILSDITKYTKSNVVIPSQLQDVFKSANDITKGVNNMHFKHVDIDISLNKGKIQFEKLEMKGGKLKAIRSISIKGFVDLNDQMSIRTRTSFAGVVIPLEIKGTIDNPTPDLTKLLSGLVLGTAENLLETGFDVGKGLTKDGINVGKKLGSILGRSTKDTTK